MKHPGIRLRVLVDGAEIVNATSADLFYISTYGGYGSSEFGIELLKAGGFPVRQPNDAFAMGPNIEIFVEPLTIEIDDPGEAHARRFTRSAKRAFTRKQPFQFGD